VTIAASASLRSAFADTIEAFCRTHGYDGVDIDWEFPQDAAQRTNQNLLIQAVRDKFNSSGAPAPSWEITMAVSPGNWYGQWNDYAYLNNVIDYYNLMTYDYHGAWSPHSGHNSPLYQGSDPTAGENIDWSFNYMTVTRGVPAAKMNMGMPFYGYRFPSSETLYDNCGGSCASALQMNYNAIVPLIGAGWTRTNDAASRVPYLSYDAGAGLISYDEPASITEKVNYALSQKGFGGIFMWEITSDYSAGSQPLLDAMWQEYSSFCGIPQATATRTNTPVSSTTPTSTRTAVLSQTMTATRTIVSSSTFTRTATQAATATLTGSMTPVSSATGTATSTVSFTATASFTPTFTQTNTPYHSPTVTQTITETITGTPPTSTETPTITQTRTMTLSFTATA
ncbi:MAG TPA: glycoside hydrolase family 18 protein, partial [Candidatus Goldiibacteriota bacterium]|nr:glycoside hydrolase family 18 protein [Candidatus Goldiibacteriota bacterium]